MDASEFSRIQLIHRFRPVKNHEGWMRKLEDLSNAILESRDLKRQNYSIPRLDLEGHLSFDLLVHGDRIAAFSGIYSGGRFPEGAYRVLNRCFVAPEYRRHVSRRISDLNSRFLLKAQMHEFQDQIRLAFVSREGLLGCKFLRQWAQENAPTPGWTVSRNLMRVVTRSHDRSAYQYICYHGDESLLSRMEQLSPEEWAHRYETN